MKSDGRRIARAEHEVQAAVADLLLRDFRDEFDTLVSVSRVQMPGDLRTAKVYISAYNATPKRQEEIVKILQKQAGEFQKHLTRKITMKFCPKLTFFVDVSTNEVLKIERILDDLSKSRAPKSTDDEKSDDDLEMADDDVDNSELDSDDDIDDEEETESEAEIEAANKSKSEAKAFKRKKFEEQNRNIKNSDEDDRD